MGYERKEDKIHIENKQNLHRNKSSNHLSSPCAYPLVISQHLKLSMELEPSMGLGKTGNPLLGAFRNTLGMTGEGGGPLTPWWSQQRREFELGALRFLGPVPAASLSGLQARCAVGYPICLQGGRQRLVTD